MRMLAASAVAPPDEFLAPPAHDGLDESIELQPVALGGKFKNPAASAGTVGAVIQADDLPPLRDVDSGEKLRAFIQALRDLLVSSFTDREQILQTPRPDKLTAALENRCEFAEQSSKIGRAHV